MSISLVTRFRVLKRDRFTCVYCGAHPPQVQIEVDHFFPAARGGTDDIGNLVTSCLECNRGKGTDIIEKDQDWPEEGSLLWDWIVKGANYASDDIKRRLLDRDEDVTLADVVEQIWPEADY